MGTKITSLLSLTLLITIYKKQNPLMGTKITTTNFTPFKNQDIKNKSPKRGRKLQRLISITYFLTHIKNKIP